jgi:hypothetical protein
MELTAPSSLTLKITSKKGIVLVNPSFVDEAAIVIIDDNAPDISEKYPETLVIYGPGEFESSGIMIKGTRPESDTMYVIDTGEGKILHAISTSIAKLSDEDDYDVVVIRAVSPVEEAELSALSSKLVVVYGDSENIPQAIKENTVNKINLRKKDELTSNVVYLEKK